MQSILIVLAIFGAVTGIGWFLKWCKHAWGSGLARWRGRVTEHTEYYVKRLEVVLIWHSSCQHYEGFWYEHLVPRRNGTDRIHRRIGPADSGTFTFESLNEHQIEGPLESSTVRTNHVYYDLVLKTQAQKRERIDLAVKITATAHSGKTFPTHLVIKPVHRMDELVMRVIFPDKIPANIHFQTLDASSHAIQDPEKLRIDQHTCECRRDILFAQPYRRYAITWSKALDCI
jgi:hypothetical protein